MKRGCAAFLLALAASSAAVSAQAPDDIYREGLALYEIGHYGAALQAMEDAARQGHVRAQEVAGLMRLAGPALYGEQVARDAPRGRAWLAGASQSGSDMARRMTCAAKRGGPCDPLQQASAQEDRH